MISIRPSRCSARITHVQTQLTAMWDVLATMTPSDYSAFRNFLGHSSGFQSLQYRTLEFRLGNKNAEMIAVHKHDPGSLRDARSARSTSPSLYDEVLRLLSRRGYGIPEDYLSRDFSAPYRASKAVAGAWLGVYHNAEKDWDLYELAERLVDLDHKFQLWRCHHHDDRGAHHRLQARHRRHGRCVLSCQGDRAAILPGAVADPHGDVNCAGSRHRFTAR